MGTFINTVTFFALSGRLLQFTTGVQFYHQLIEILAGEIPPERLCYCFIVVLELENPGLKLHQRFRIRRREDLSLKDRKVDFDLVEPAGMNGCVHRDYGLPFLRKPINTGLTPVRRTVVHNPKYSSGRFIRLLAHDLVHQSFEGSDASLSFASTKDPCSMNIPSRKISQSAFSLIFVFNPHRRTRLGWQRLGLSLSCLDTGLFISGNDIIRRSQRNPHPLFLIQVQDRPCLTGKLGVTRKKPTTILPRFYSISTQPSPNGDPTDTGNNALLQNEPFEILTTESRDGNAQSRGKFACQRLNRHHDSGGKTGRAARIWNDPTTHPDAARKIACAIYSQFAVAC